MPSEAVDKTVITDNWPIFLKFFFQHFVHHEKILKVTKFQFKIIFRSRVLDKSIPLWYIVPTPPPSPGTNRVNKNLIFIDSFQFLSSSLDNLGKYDFKQLS